MSKKISSTTNTNKHYLLHYQGCYWLCWPFSSLFFSKLGILGLATQLFIFKISYFNCQVVTCRTSSFHHFSLSNGHNAATKTNPSSRNWEQLLLDLTKKSICPINYQTLTFLEIGEHLPAILRHGSLPKMLLKLGRCQ